MNDQSLFVRYSWVIPIAIEVTVVLGIILAIIGVGRRRARPFSLPRPKSGPLVRWGEMALWIIGVGLLIVSYRAQFGDYLQGPGVVPALPEELGRRTALIALAASPVLILAAFRRLRAAALCLAVETAGVLASGLSAYEWPAVEAAVANSPIPFTFSTPPGLPPVTVTANDVPLGTTPVITTWEDLKARTPVWKVESEFHQQTGGGTLLWCWLLTHNAGTRAASDQRDERNLFLRYHLGERPLFLYSGNSFRWTGFVQDKFSGSGSGNGVHMGNRAYAVINPGSVAPSMTLPEWGDEVQFLLHRARLMDYAVDDHWCTAFESYGELGETALMALLTGDPALQRVIDSFARRKYRLPASSISEGEAWERLMALVEEGGRRGEFRFAGYEGSAVRHLASQISAESLARRTATALAGNFLLPGRGVETHWLKRGQALAFRIVPRDPDLDGRWLWPHVLEQLAIERDAALDAVSQEPDNPIEIHVTPVLMRQRRVGEGAERQIEGHAYEQALVRHNWHRQPPDPAVFEDGEFVMGGFLNHWLLRLGDLESPFGREFRIAHRHEFFKLAQEIWREPRYHHNSLPETLDFLFREHRADIPGLDENGRTLAESFWKTFAEWRGESHAGDEALRMRWTYLARMSPDSRPEQFVAAYRDLDPQWIHSWSADLMKLMPPDAALAALGALLAEIERQSATRKDLPRSRFLPQDRRLLIQSSLAIDHPGIARVAVAELDRQDTSFNLSTLEYELREGRVSPAVLRQLAADERADVRKTVAETALYRTDPASRALLEQLSHDPQEAVRTAALNILRQWTDWQARPLPTRVLPAP